jgi:hypothetical protein
MKTGPTRNDYDDEDYFPFGSAMGSLAHVVYEEPRPGPRFIGLLDHRGHPIYRVSPPKPPIGFSADPYVNQLFEFDPETAFAYTSDLGPIPEDEEEFDPDEGD